MKRLRQWLRSLLDRSERYRIRSLEKSLVELQRDFGREFAEARKPGSNADLGEIESRYSGERGLISEEIDLIRTEQILRRARGLRVRFPSPRPSSDRFEDDDENWWLGPVMRFWLLTDRGEANFRDAIRAEEKVRRDVVSSWISSIGGLIGIGTGFVAVLSMSNSFQQKELSRLAHLPHLKCYVVWHGGQDSLIVMNAGDLVRRMSVERIAFFDVRPFRPPHGTPRLVRYLLDDYYADQLGQDYEGNQRMVFGTASDRGNASLAEYATNSVADSLQRHGFAFSGIEVGRAVRVEYWDWVNTRSQEYYWATAPGAGGPEDFERVSQKRWRALKSTADSLRRSRRTLSCTSPTRTADVQRIIEECMQIAR